ncbi:hypothetical protein [Bacillus sp. 03113]|uniref:hypothetical protein n=1 Tax=Bacillus sp. 03113 TaxID=2578211 RepID=UPI001142B7EB|nr:hypothetical protein [Bacillus sp. 03113]
MYTYYYDRQVNWLNILNLLQRSLFAEEMVCSMSSELYHIPQTKDLKGNNEMHNHLVPASYHRVTAVGSAQRLNTGEQRQSIIDTMITCINNAEKQDRSVKEWLRVMEGNASSEFKPFIQMIIRWQNQAEHYLNQAKTELIKLGISISAEGEQPSGY